MRNHRIALVYEHAPLLERPTEFWNEDSKTERSRTRRVQDAQQEPYCNELDDSGCGWKLLQQSCVDYAATGVEPLAPFVGVAAVEADVESSVVHTLADGGVAGAFCHGSAFDLHAPVAGSGIVGTEMAAVVHRSPHPRMDRFLPSLAVPHFAILALALASSAV